MARGKIDPEVNQHIQHEQSEDRQRERLEMRRQIEKGDAPWMEHEGILGVVTAVRDQEFPRTFDQLRRDIGDREVITMGKRTESLEDVLDVLEPHLDARKDHLLEDWGVPSLRDFHQIVQRHWEAVRFHNVPDEQRPRKGGAGPQDPRTHR